MPGCHPDKKLFHKKHHNFLENDPIDANLVSFESLLIKLIKMCVINIHKLVLS